MDMKNRRSFGRSSSVETRPLVSSITLEKSIRENRLHILCNSGSARGFPRLRYFLLMYIFCT